MAASRLLEEHHRMAIDTDRLVTIANELKSMEKRREELLGELHRIAGGAGGAASLVPRRRGRPPRSMNQERGYRAG
jgi:hypothetical protein